MKIRIPISERSQALFVVDIQPKTLKSLALPSVQIMRKVIEATHYPLYVVVTYYAEQESMFYKQGQWLLPKAEAGSADEAILAEIESKNSRLLHLTKTTRSCFKADQKENLMTILKEENIAEVHIVGYDINDCVLATAYDAIDLGYYTYVLEEACHHYAGERSLVESALTIMRRQHMTNHSKFLQTKEIEIN